MDKGKSPGEEEIEVEECEEAKDAVVEEVGVEEAKPVEQEVEVDEAKTVDEEQATSPESQCRPLLALCCLTVSNTFLIHKEVTHEQGDT